MAITIKVGESQKEEENSSIKMKLVVRKTINGNIMIMDHNDIDIIIVPSSNKIITFPKKTTHDDVYLAQDRLFNYLSKKGIVKRDTIQGGNVYASIEAIYPDAVDNVDTTQIVLFTIGKWIEEEKPIQEMEEYYEKEWEKHLTEPNEEESTELGEVPGSEKKGSITTDRIRKYLSNGTF